MSQGQPRLGKEAVSVLRSGVRQLGNRFDDSVLEATKALYSGWLRTGEASRTAALELPYGRDARQRLDLYRPADLRGPAPMLLYVPGGGFVAGDKNMGQGFYANVGGYFAAQGFITAVMNYRLAPTSPWPAGSEDVAGAIEWLAREAARWSGDADRLFVVGQSAGAAHVAGVLFDPAFERAASRIRAAVLMSGFYQAQSPMRPGPLAYFGADESAYANRSPASLVREGHAPVLLTAAEFDPAGMVRQTLLLADRLIELDGQCPPLMLHRGHNHVSTVLSIGTPDDDVGRALLEFFREHD